MEASSPDGAITATLGSDPAEVMSARSRGASAHVRPPARRHSLSARGTTRDEGHVVGNVHASYLHTNWAATPGVAARLVEAAG